MAETFSDDLAVIRYHVWWPSSSDPYYRYNISENQARNSYYGNNYTPHFFIDGNIDAGSNHSNWGNMINNEIQVSSPLEIEIYGSFDQITHTGDLTIFVTATEAITYSNLKLRIALTESNLYWQAPNGSVWHNQTFRDMIPNTSGIPFVINEGETLEFTQTFSCPSPLRPANCDIVVFVQSDSGHRILQGAKENVTFLPYLYSLTPFSLISPADDTTISDCYPNFIWHSSNDPDSGYPVNYQVYFSPDSTFSSPFISDTLSDTSWQCPVCLQYDTTYYWKVLAFNGHAPDRFSNEVFSFIIDAGEIVVEPSIIDSFYMVVDDTSQIVMSISNLSYDTVSYSLSDSGDIISFENDSGQLAPFATDSITVFFSTVGLDPVVYNDTIYVTTDHVIDNLIKVPVILMVYVHGDANCDGSVLGNDVTFLVRYFKGIGSPPCDPLIRADTNGNCEVTGSDVTYLVNYFKGIVGPPIVGDCD